MSEQEPSETSNEDAGTGGDVLDANGPCMSCGSPNARIWHTPDGPARLCPPCATLNGIGCP